MFKVLLYIKENSTYSKFVLTYFTKVIRGNIIYIVK